MFFDDEPLVSRKAARLREPPILRADWRPPSSFPNLSSAVQLSYDVETKETDFDRGPGWARGKGHIVGFSVGAVDIVGNRGAWYFPIRHEVEPEYNLDPASCLRWLDAQLNTPLIPKVGANLMYDNGWLGDEGVRIAGPLHDVQFAEAILDEDAFVSLDVLAHKYLNEGKRTEALYDWLAQAYGGKPGQAQRANIYRASPRLVGPYGEGDAIQPFDMLRCQWRELEREDLVSVYRMECDLIPLLIAMRRQGVQIDLEHAEKLYHRLGVKIAELYAALTYNVGFTVVSVDSNYLQPLFDSVNVPYPLTPTGKPSFKKEWLEALEHPLGKSINEIRGFEKIRGTFVESYLLNGHVNGKIHCQFHPLRNDDGGAKTGRFASSDPNLQNIPVRTTEGKEVRKAFIPFRGHKRIRKIDYSQIEYRMLANYAVNEPQGFSADILRQTYIDNPDADYHDVVYDNVGPMLGYDLTDKSLRKEKRRPIKNINFGLLYGQSAKALAYKAGLSDADSKIFFKAYHAGAPYVKPTMQAIAYEAQINGYVCTIMNRRTRFKLWEPMNQFGMTALPYNAAIAAYGSYIKRAFDYRAVNYKLQGSAADVIKYAMLTAWNAGVFDVTGVPLLQVHDELDFSEIDDTPKMDEAWRELSHILETSTPLRIPIKVDVKTGATWGDID